jgi:hypothetical protein
MKFDPTMHMRVKPLQLFEGELLGVTTRGKNYIPVFGPILLQTLQLKSFPEQINCATEPRLCTNHEKWLMT